MSRQHSTNLKSNWKSNKCSLVTGHKFAVSKFAGYKEFIINNMQLKQSTFK